MSTQTPTVPKKRDRKAYNKAWRKANPERVRENHKKWHKENPEKHKIYRDTFRSKNPRYRGANEGKKIDIEEIKRAEVEQNGVCKICGKNKKLVVDHCHATGKFRGLLCGSCNTGLGMFKDNPVALTNAIRYLA